MRFDIVGDTIVVAVEIQVIDDTIVVTVSSVFSRRYWIVKRTLTEAESKSGGAVGIVEQFDFEPAGIQVVQLNIIVRIIDRAAEANKPIVFQLGRKAAAIFKRIRMQR